MGTLVCLERAQALRQPLAYFAPLLLAAGALGQLLPYPLVARGLLLAGTLGFSLVLALLWRRSESTLVAASTLAAWLLVLAVWLWEWVPFSATVPLLGAWIIITIAAERAELATLDLGEKAGPQLTVFASILAVGATLAVGAPRLGGVIFGISCAALALWLFLRDVGRKFAARPGLPGFNAACLLAGNFWLAIGGLAWLAGTPYDLQVHAIFLGFAFNLIFAHAPIILPTVLGRPLPYHQAMWVPFGLLQMALALRALGTLGEQYWLTQSGGILSVFAILGFLGVAVSVVLFASRGRQAAPSSTSAASGGTTAAFRQNSPQLKGLSE
ncbi:hypothetical protein [Boudabousia tangfeifanii]|nr:hypothetical protein [Boudabousia tangfeifanii]